ncbi:Heparinase II/III-like protein [Planctomycetes bacterium MalM25]|nr:Heparinase II/III-like protein [Planctomycetes bacterium MalM25]
MPRYRFAAAPLLAILLSPLATRAEAPRRFETGFPLNDRAGWERLAEHPSLHAVMPAAESLVDSTPQEIPDDLYLEFSRSGDRNAYQKPYFARRRAVVLLAIAEGIENRGRFLPALDRYVRAVCEERVWCLPAHDRKLEAYHGKKAVLDLFLAETSWNLGLIAQTFQDRLPAETIRLIDQNLQRRTFEPYERILAGEAAEPWWLNGTNNWNAVCLAGVTGAALTRLEESERRRLYVDKAEQAIQNFLDGFTPDGYCSEGVGYWNYGFGHYLLLSETVRQATRGEQDWLAGPRVRAIATYPMRLAIEPTVWPWFSDCSPGSKPSPVLLEFLAKRLGEPTLAPGANRTEQQLYQSARPELYAIATFYRTLLDPTADSPARTELPLRDAFPDAGVYVLRPAQTGGLSVALKAGHNGEHHNHNDVGSYAIVLGGVTLLGDAGKEVYTAATFDSRRYLSPFNNSYGHPVPVVGGELQSAGRKHGGEVIDTVFTDETDEVTIDLTGVYDLPSLESLQRKFTYRRGAEPSLVIEDRVRFTRPETFETALITMRSFEQASSHQLTLGEGDSAIVVTLRSDRKLGPVRVSTLKGDSVSGRPVTRLGAQLLESAPAATVRITVTPQPQ